MDNDLPVAVVGTAGHIDHGKSALVRALTGTDPDRLPEEKKRGITIELGYARLALPSGRSVSVVDVPGHERFIKTMASGAAVIDVAILVVDAGEGVKPQSVEHLGILQALGVKRGLVALTKCDTVDPDLANLAAEEVRELVASTFLEGAPVIMTSTVSGQGLASLRETIDAITVDFRKEAVRMPVRMPVDRVFVMQGFGTVITGTVLGGTISVADTVQVLPAGIEARVRGVQVHGTDAGLVHAPSRAALNLAGVEMDPALRGQWVVSPGEFATSGSVLAMASLMGWVKKTVKLPASMSLNLGSSVVNCAVHGVADGPRQEPMIPGTAHLVRIETDHPVVPRAGDRFILRVGGGLGAGFSTAAGGWVVDPLWGPRRISTRVQDQARKLDASDPQTWLEFALMGAGAKGLATAELVQRIPGPPASAQRILDAMLRTHAAIRTGRARIVGSAAYGRALARADQCLKTFHASNPERAGIKRDALRDLCVGGSGGPLFESLLSRRVKEKAWKLDQDLVAEADHEPRSATSIEDLASSILASIARDPASPPSLKALAQQHGVSIDWISRAADLIVASGRGRLLDGEFIFSTGFLDTLKGNVRAFFARNEKMMVTDLKTIASVTRKHALPLARWLDDEGVTLRRADHRIARS